VADPRIEVRPDGSVVLTDPGSRRWGVAAAGVVVGGWLLASLATSGLTLVATVVTGPIAVIAILAGVAAARHRDWIVFDRPARAILVRRGLVAMFRPVSTVPFDEVEAILVEDPEAAGGLAEVSLRRAGDFVWPIDASADAAYVRRLVAALAEVGGWPVIRERETVRP
jgi:hypothetical protein